MKHDKNDRRKTVSFKENLRDEKLLDWAIDRAESYSGFSAYIKTLIQEDMKRGGNNE